jgi:hypothetical protein
MIPISGLRRVMWRDNRIRVGIWGQELGTRRKRRWKKWSGRCKWVVAKGWLLDDLLDSEWPYLS